MKIIVTALIGTLLPVCCVSAEKEATKESPMPSTRLMIHLTVKQASLDAKNNPTIELSSEEGETADGLLIVFLTERGRVDASSGSSGPQDIERFIEFRTPAGGDSGIPQIIARHFGAKEIDLFNGAGSAASMRLSPEKLPGSGGNFWLHEGPYSAKGYHAPVIRLGMNCMFEKGSNKVTLVIWERSVPVQ